MSNMNTLLATMNKPINEEYAKFEQHFSDSLLTDVKLINSVVRYITKRILVQSQYWPSPQ